MTNAQCIHKTRECGVLRYLNRIKHVLCGLLRHTLQLRQLRHAQTVQIIRRFHQSHIDQLLNQFIAQPVDIHRLARRKVHQALFQLRRTNQAAGTTRHRFTLLTHNRRSTFRALRRHHEYARIIRAFLDDAHHHLGNHVTRTPHHHGVANAHIFARDFIRVVQRRIGHHHATDFHRREPRHRRNRPRTSNLNGNILHQGRHLLRREFMRERPAWRTRYEAECLLLRRIVHLIHHTVDIKWQFIALLAGLRIKREQAICPRHHGLRGKNRKAQRA